MFAQRLKAAREFRHHSQASLAELMNVAPQHVYRLETGKHVPSSDTVVLLSHVLDVSSDYLLGLTNDMTGRHLPSELSDTERRVLEALRSGDKFEAVKAIVGDP